MNKIALAIGFGLTGIGLGGLLWRSSSSKSTGLGALPAQAPMTRDSCLECVDKHLGAALVLITETRDGYPHRLRAIGHLHEAEDESQAWPALHDAIREARKRFQQAGEVPNFTAIEALSAQIRSQS